MPVGGSLNVSFGGKMVLSFLILFIVALLAVIFGVFDAHATIAGIEKGVGVEGNSLITFWAGNKPKLWQLYLFNNVVIGIPLLVAALFAHSVVLPIAMTGSLLANALHHIVGKNEWEWLIANPGKFLPGDTLLQKTGIWFLFHNK
jgi:hypothetical protein